MRELRVLPRVPGLALKTKHVAALFHPGVARKKKERIQPMDFFKILNIAGTILAWIIVLAVVWAAAPVIMKLFVVVQSIHNFAK